MDKYTLLKQYFGHDSFRPGQETLIDSLLDGRDALGVMPTGAGKSMCYQIPALLLPGITLVVSPLISLMKDQVMSLCQAGVPAAYLNSSLTFSQYCEALRRAGRGAYKIIYVAPERLLTPGFQDFVQYAKISLVAVDEAHCVSQWGQDFRPSYLQIADFVESLPVRPVLAAFTATATKEVRRDIVELLRLREPTAITTGFDRENLYFAVEHPANKQAAILQLVQERAGRSGIIYCATRKNVETVCDLLRENGIEATRYHAGLDEAERRQNQEDFSFDRTPVMVATNAFGMGIDKSNVSYVLHYNMPKNLESYYQEAGRAGRDGGEAECILLFSHGDVHTAKFLIENGGENEALTPEAQAALRKKDLERLDDMTAYCLTHNCLRAQILRYFGESCPETCGKCGNCRGTYEEIDVTDLTEKVLKAIQSVENRYNTAFGISVYANLLHGTKNKVITAFGMHELRPFGAFAQMPLAEIRDLLEQLRLQGYVQQETQNGYPVLTIGPAAPEVLSYGQQVRIRRKLQAPKTRKMEVQELSREGKDLYAVLRNLRSRLAAEAHVPAYMVFSNVVLERIAAQAPSTLDELLTISGIGAAKAHKYGHDFLEAIRYFKETAAAR